MPLSRSQYDAPDRYQSLGKRSRPYLNAGNTAFVVPKTCAWKK